ncbi:hypothetical protein ACN469_09210 [Corallococcus terminator]
MSPHSPSHDVLRCTSPRGARHALFAYPDDDALRSWMGGRRFGPSLPPVSAQLEVRIQRVGVLPELTDDGLPLMTPRLRQAFDEAGVVNLDCYPAVVVNRQARRWDYVAFNIVGRIAAADPARSVLHPSIPWVDRLVLVEDALRELSVCRLAESPDVILIRADIKAHVEASGISTLSFIAPGNWVG